MPRKKKDTDAELGWFGNPYYTGRGKPTGTRPVERPSCRSRHWSRLSPAWLVQECLNRGCRIPHRVEEYDRVDGGWHVTCWLGHPLHPVRWEGFVSDAEVEAGEMQGEAA